MTAIERLRSMLDERGVEWLEPVQMEDSEFTRWHDANGVQWTASEVHGSNKLRIGASFITPEQAIAATLGDDEVARLRSCMAADRETHEELLAECGKLRELVRDMFYAVHPADREKFLTNVAELGVEI